MRVLIGILGFLMGLAMFAMGVICLIQGPKEGHPDAALVGAIMLFGSGFFLCTIALETLRMK